MYPSYDPFRQSLLFKLLLKGSVFWAVTLCSVTKVTDVSEEYVSSFSGSKSKQS
jgi:hypothetical protein